MPFNPLLPVDGSLIVAAELRGQFTGLDDKIADAATVTQLNDTATVLSQDIQTASDALTLDIQAAVSGSSANTNAVNLLSVTSGDFVVQTIIEKMNEHLLASRR